MKNRVTVYFESKVERYIGESIHDAPDFFRAAQKIVIPLRKLMKEQEIFFDGSFKVDCQQKSVRILLLTVISTLVDGASIRNKSFSQQSLTVTQLIQSNFKKRVELIARHIIDYLKNIKLLL